jgi:hypothetical protein
MIGTNAMRANGVSIRVAMAAALLGLSALLAGCGGGGGGGGGNPGPVTPTAVSGQLTLLDAQGDIAPAPAGREVQLVALGPQGEPGAVLATTTTDGTGSFQLGLPAGRSPGLTLGVVAPDGAGGRWRAVALNADAPVGPASEAVTQELFAALARSTVAVAPDARLGHFYRNASLWLGLLNPRQTAPAQAVEHLRAALRDDPASAQALDELVRLGRLSSSLGDIGGLFGFGSRVLEINDSDEGLRIVLPRPSPGVPGEWTLDEFRPAGGTIPDLPDRTWLRLQDDGVQRVRSNFGTPTTVALQGLIGPYQEQSFRWTPGVELALASVQRPTDGLDFGGDGRADTLNFSVTQRFNGAETLDILGERRRALSFTTTNLLRIDLSEGGSITVRGTERRWHLPELGAVRSEESNEAVDRQGRVTTGTLQRVAQRAVAGSTSWPGRVRLAVSDLSIPTDFFAANARGLGLTAAQQLLVRRFVEGPCCQSATAVSLRPLQGGSGAEVTIQPGLLGVVLALSPDGRRLYAATSPFLGGDGTNVALPPAEAAALGATIVRYDATSLVEEARFQLPPIPSRLQPGLAFPRHMVRTLLVSPTDSTELAVAGIDAALVRGSTVVSAIGNQAGWEERIGADGRARLNGDQVLLRGWDADRQELRLEISGGGEFSRALPVTAAGLNLSALRNAAPVLFALGATGDLAALYDHVDRQRLYLGGFSRVLNPDTGAQIASRLDSPDLALRGAPCARRASSELLCLTDRIHLLDADLRPLRTWPLQLDLRRIVGSPDFAPSGPLLPGPDGQLIVVGTTPSGRSLAAYRLSFD